MLELKKNQREKRLSDSAQYNETRFKTRIINICIQNAIRLFYYCIYNL